MAPLLFDTCAVVWLANGDRVREPALAAIAHARRSGATLAVSAFSAWEIATKVAKGRLFLAMSPEAYFEAFVNEGDVTVVLPTTRVLIASCFLPGAPPADPADRIIAATAREFGYAVVTRDRPLLDYAAAGHINAIEC